MKRPGYFLLLYFMPVAGFCQTKSDTIPLKDIVVPTSPGFTLLDVAPTTVDRPASFKQLSLNVANTVPQSGSLPQNFAMEFAPIWLVRHPNMTIFKYNGIKMEGKAAAGRGASGEGTKVTSAPNVFYGVRNFTASVATAVKDSGQGVGVKTNFIAYGIRANIITFRKRRVLDSLEKSILDLNAQLSEDGRAAVAACKVFLDSNDTQKYLDCIQEQVFVKDSTVLQQKTAYYDTILSIRPVFTADIAVASSTAFGNNSYSQRHGYRTGGWLTVCYAQPLSGKANKTLSDLYGQTSYVNIYGMARVMREDSTTDFKHFQAYTFWDVGGRFELELDRLAVSFESVHRNVKENPALNSFRNVGILQYKVNDNFYLTGTFGKNFGGQTNLVAFLGLNFGFGKTTLYNKLE